MAKIPARNLFLVIQKRFLKTSAALVTPPPLPTKSSSSSATQKLRFVEKEGQNAQSVVEFLKSHGFSSTHIAKLIEWKRPLVLNCDVEKTLKPKFNFLVENGFVGEFLVDLVIANPTILTRALDSHIKPTIELLKSVLGSTTKIVAAVKRNHWLFNFPLESVMKPNIGFLIKQGVPVDRVAKLVTAQPRAITQKHDRIVNVVNAVKNLGVEPNSLIFIHCVGVMIQMNEPAWKKKLGLFKSLGWSEEQFLSAFRRYPHSIACSEEKIRKMVDFFVNTLKLGQELIIASPKLLYLSIDKTLLPRYNIFKVLQTKKLIKSNNVCSLFKMTENKFFESYVVKYADKVPGLLEMYDDAKKAKR